MSGYWLSRSKFFVFVLAMSVLVGVWMSLSSGPVWGIDEHAKGVLDALARVEPRVEKDKDAVVVFFDFFCPHCAEQVPTLLHWADTVPKDKVHVRFSPVIGGDMKRVWLGYGFFVGTKVLGYRGSVALTQELFGLVRSSQAFTLETVSKILAKHCGRERILGLGGLDDVEQAMKAIDGDFMRYRIEVVPSVGIAGRYVITPDDLPPGGGEEAFVTLLNGFVSRMVAADL